jgi:hypothetical protein
MASRGLAPNVPHVPLGTIREETTVIHTPQGQRLPQNQFSKRQGNRHQGQQGQGGYRPATRRQTRALRDQNPEINDRVFLKKTVSVYKQLLSDNSYLLKASAKWRSPVVHKFESQTVTESVDHSDILDIMGDWNAEYAYAQTVLNVCRSQLRSWLMKQDPIVDSHTHFVRQRYNLDFQNFKTISTREKNPITNPARWFKRTPGDDPNDEIIAIYTKRVHSEEREFLKDVIQKFIEVVEKEIVHDGLEDNEIASLGLIKFEFDNLDVQTWTGFYKDMKQSQHTKQPRQNWPKLPLVCDFKNSAACDSKFKSTDEKEVEQRKQVLETFKKFELQYTAWATNAQDAKRKQNNAGLRIWFHTRAWNAFRKAIQSNLQRDEQSQNAYMDKNRIQCQGPDQANKYLVLGSTMTMALALPPTSRASYLVSFERS